MNELESSPLNASPASRRAARSAIDGALSRDRGRLLGLWRRWEQAAGDDARRKAFEEALTRSLAQREPADWSAEAREWAEKNGLIVGDGNGNKQYRSFVTREQLAVFLKRLRELEK